MADARKRARRGESASGPPEPAAAGAPGTPGTAPSEGGTIALPASGLAEDILRRLEGEPGKAEPAPPQSASPPPAGRIELPASGLAEEVLPREEAPDSHSLSFFAAPAQEQRVAAAATEHLATFFLDREEYGVDVRQVQEIRRVAEITTVPRAPDFVRGVINLRGRILPVLDLKRKLGLGEVVIGRPTRIVVVRLGERLLGLLVDGASQVLKVELSRIEPPPSEVVEKGGDYIRGVAKLDDRLIILVDLERLLAHELRAANAPAPGARPAEGEDGVS
jgi:purine-binding chemotaxis protein CheW